MDTERDGFDKLLDDGPAPPRGDWHGLMAEAAARGGRQRRPPMGTDRRLVRLWLSDVLGIVLGMGTVLVSVMLGIGIGLAWADWAGGRTAGAWHVLAGLACAAAAVGWALPWLHRRRWRIDVEVEVEEGEA